MVSTPSVPSGRPENHDDPTDDPTGVRALLAGLGDPGPMPADLVDRINASIAAEQQARSDHDRTVVPLRRRSSWPKVGLAAAAVAAVAVTVPALLGTGPGELMASLSRVGSASSADSAAGSAASPASPAGPEAVRPDAGGRASGATGPVTLGTSGTAYTSVALPAQARSVLDRAPYGSSDTQLKDATSNELTLRACLTALGVDTWMPVSADAGTYDGQPAVVAVVSSDTGQRVYAVTPDCDATHPNVIAGPVPLP